ncbi:hypothetical protein [Streptococcus suis]|uniref:Uncharacterized protein n=1 Tax=Streptococcus suis TaxID=1307 RepID=A0A0Z8UA59_STRSU|nr:hypothetical protein [Streptococcus suis]NQR95522.1 hypothetical protein [Streptococcus suis]CYX33939.1 Uncharacterised protein [Streptococcus suis]
MELVLPNNYVALEQEEIMYLDGEGWIADSFAVGGGVIKGFVWAVQTASYASALGTVALPIVGTVSVGTLGAISGAVTGYITGYKTGRWLGRWIETNIFGWK